MKPCKGWQNCKGTHPLLCRDQGCAISNKPREGADSPATVTPAGQRLARQVGHTPGPWKGVIPGQLITAEDGSCVALVYSTFSHPYCEALGAEVVANISLIAAAPELLAVLKAIFELATIQHLEQHDVWADVLLPAYDAIAKAEGGAE